MKFVTFKGLRNWMIAICAVQMVSAFGMRGGVEVGGTAFANFDSDEVAVAKAELQREIDICKTLSDYVELRDQARLKIIRESSELTFDAITKYGLGNMTTMNLFQMQIITYQYSERFFENIRSPGTDDLVTEISEIAAKIKRDRGGPYLKITHHIFTNTEKHFRELRSLVAGQPLARKIDSMNLWAELGDVIASSEGGDSPTTTNCKAVLLYRKIKTLYPDLYEGSAASPIFDVSQSIIGLMEFYNEYAKPDEARCMAVDSN